MKDVCVMPDVSVSQQVVTILLGLFQLVLCVPLIHTDQTLPKLFILPLVLGILVSTSEDSYSNSLNY